MMCLSARDILKRLLSHTDFTVFDLLRFDWIEELDLFNVPFTSAFNLLQVTSVSKAVDKNHKYAEN